MPRRARIVLPGVPHHITQRGNFRNRMFFCDEDKEYFLNDLKEYSERYGTQIAAYCLMDNHTHLCAIPANVDSLKRSLTPVHLRYSQYLNKKFKRKGINWQGRYFSSAMDEAYTWATFQYIAMNPVKASMVVSPVDYRWSSAAAHMGIRTDETLTADTKWQIMAFKAVSELILKPRDLNSFVAFDKIEKALFSNLPIGSADFISNLEKIFSCKLTYSAPGRPRRGN